MIQFWARETKEGKTRIGYRGACTVLEKPQTSATYLKKPTEKPTLSFFQETPQTLQKPPCEEGFPLFKKKGIQRPKTRGKSQIPNGRQPGGT